MATKSLQVVLSATDRNLSKVIGDAETHSTTSAHHIGSAFTALGNIIGGEVQDAFDKLSDASDKFGEKGLSSKLTAVGAAAMGVGGVLTAMGASEQQATQQLNQAIENTGHSAEEFEGQIDGVVHQMEHYGDSAIQTKSALQTLVQATHDPQEAIDSMGEAANLAASRHISLTEAAQQLAKVLDGHGTRTLALYGIQVKKNADGTQDLTDANNQLAHLLQGQAAAAANTWTGKLKGLRTEITDNVAEFGQKFGPAIMAGGMALTALGPAIGAARSGVSKLSAAMKEGETSVGALGGKLGMLGLQVGGIAAVMYAGDKLGHSISSWAEKGETAGWAMDNAGKAADVFREALDASNGVVTDGVRRQVAYTAQNSGLAAQAAAAGISLKQLTNGITGNDKATLNLLATWGKSGKLNNDNLYTLMALIDAFKKGKKSALELAAATEDTSTAQTKLAAATDDTHLSLVLAAEATDYLKNSLLKLSDETVSAKQAQLQFEDSLAGATQQVKDNGTSLDANTVKGRSNREWLLSQITSLNQVAEAQLAAGDSAQSVTGKLGANEQALRRAAIAAAMNADQVNRLVRSAEAMPRQLDVWLRAHGVTVATQQVQNLRTELDNLPRQVGISVNATGDINVKGAGHYAGGTDYAPGGRAVVGERGREVVDLPRGSRITPTGATPPGSGGGDTYLTVNIAMPQFSTAPSADIGRQVASHLEAFVVRGGLLHVASRIR